MPAKPGIAFVEFETEMQVGGGAPALFRFAVTCCAPKALQPASPA